MVLCLSYAPSGDMLAVGDFDGSIHFFNVQGEKLQSPVSGHSDDVNSVSWSPDGSKLASGSRKNIIDSFIYNRIDPTTQQYFSNMPFIEASLLSNYSQRSINQSQRTIK